MSSISNNVALQEVQEIVSRIASNKGVNMVWILNGSGDIVVTHSTKKGNNNDSPDNMLHAMAQTNPKFLHHTLDMARQFVVSLPKLNDVTATSGGNNNNNNNSGGVDDENNDPANNNNNIDNDNSEKKNNNKNDEDELSFVRIRSKHHEILLAPKNNYVLVVLSDPAAVPL